MAVNRNPYGGEEKPKRTRRKKQPAPEAAAAVQAETVPAEPRDEGYKKYRFDPVGYAKDVLNVDYTPDQRDICRMLFTPPYRVLVRCGHAVGKTWLGAGLTSWMFDCYDDSATLTTAPTHRDVVDLLWRSVRLQRHRAGRGGFVGNVFPEMRGESPDHYAKGFTAEKNESFAGRHQRHMLFLFDEATGIDPNIWESASSMFKGEQGHYWVCFFNPLDISCQAFKEEMRGGWHVKEMSSLNHPNIHAALAGLPEPYPGAVSVAQMNGWVKQWCDPVRGAEREANDVEWPPGSGNFFRPSPQMESRVLGRWPTGDMFGVWSQKIWRMTQIPFEGVIAASLLPEFGVDVAYHGDDYTVIHGRWGPYSFHHERHNGWSPRNTAARLKVLCEEAAVKANLHRLTIMPGAKESPPIKAEQILCKVDSDGLGVNVVDNADGFRFVPVGGSGCARQADRYYNKRTEIWFDVAHMAREGQVCTADLPHDVRQRIEQQLLAPTWKPVKGLCYLEPKEETKKRLKCSPDDADAFLLAYAPLGTMASRAWEIAAMQASANPAAAREEPWRAPDSVKPDDPRYRQPDDDGGRDGGDDSPHRRMWDFGL